MPDPVRVIAVHRFFWPDSPPYATFLRAIAARWAADGARVKVLSAQPTYLPGQPRRHRREDVDGFEVERLPALAHSRGPFARLLDLLAFPVVVAARILTGPRPDLVMCSTVPQVTLGVMTAAAARLRGAKFVYHCMDIHPEIGRLSGEFANPVAFRLLRALDSWAIRSSWRTVVLSEDMRRSIVARDARLGSRVVVRNNFALPSGAAAAETVPPAEAGRLRVVFAGNIGRFQGLEAVLEGFLDLPDPIEAELVFMGDGKARSGLQDRVTRTPPRVGLAVTFLEHGSPATAKKLMAGADVGVVSLSPGVIQYAYPSKTATYAECGLPMLVVCEADSDLARTVVRNNLGWAVRADDAPAVTSALTAAHREAVTGSAGERRRRVSEYAAAEFAEPAVLDWWSELLGDARTGRE